MLTATQKYTQYLSLIHLKKTSYARSFVNDCYLLHQRLYRAFPIGDRPHVLFRVEKGSLRNTIVVQSAERPRWEKIFFRQPDLLLDSPVAEPEVVDCRWMVGEELEFRVLANTVRHKSTKKGDAVTPVSVEDVPDWIGARSERNGFSVSSLTRISPSFVVGAKPSGHKIVFSCSLIDGKLVVTDPELLTRAVTCGFGGHGLGFGVGLLSLRRNP